MAALKKVTRVVNNVIKSLGDERLYRALELHNGLRVFLISDATTDKSSAALDVYVGSMSDPSHLPGLAHFCEHMLFLGTKKYPEENEYSKFLSEHGGGSNAYTSSEHTNYYFDVAPEHLSGALDRFAQFFLCPLFTESATEREVNAVNSENDKNLQADAWRLHQLERSTARPEHDYSKFGTGNKETLLNIPKEKNIDIRAELLKFHNKHYSSNIMGLSILGKESLDELEKMAIDLFESVENKNLTIKEWKEPPFGPKELKLHAEVVPVKDIRSLHVTWPIPDLHPYYKHSPGHYLGHLIGHEGPGSLLSALKAKGWVNQLVGGEKSGANGFMFFIVNVDLSVEGIDHINDIVTMIFQYINMLKKEQPQQWIFDECKNLSAMQFRFKDKERPQSYTSNTAGNLHDYPLEEVISAPYLLSDFKPDLINMVLDKLTPDNIRVCTIGKKFEGKTDKKEKWYGTDYSLNELSEGTLKSWREAGFHPDLCLPTKNEFIPTNFDLVQREDDAKDLPEVIKDTSSLRLWYHQDKKFLMPKSYINIEIVSPYAYTDPLSACLTYMYAVMFRDALTEYSYDAELAGLGYDFINTTYGLTLKVRGYNDKQHILLQKIVEKMTSFNIDSKRFELLKDNYVRGLKNFRAEQPHQHAVYFMSVLTSELMWTKNDLLEATEELTEDKLREFIPKLLSRVYLEFLVYGNVTKQKAIEMSELVEGILQKNSKTKPLLASQQRRFREVQLPDGCYYLYKKTNDVHKSSSLEIYYQYTVQNTETNVLLELFCKIIEEPCFNILRTKEQLGYIVFSGIRRNSGVQGLRVIVQSDRSPEYVEKRIEAFLNSMKEHLKTMSREDFKNNVEALVTCKLEKPKKMSSQNGRYWSEISCQQYNFDRENIEVEALKKLTQEDIITFYDDVISNDAPHRHKLCVHIQSVAEGQDEVTKEDGKDALDGCPAMMKQCEEVMDVTAFKRNLALFGLPKPFIDISNPKSKL